MARIGKVEIVADRRVEVRRELAGALDRAIRKAALDIEAGAKQAVTEVGAIDTGALRASIYAITPGANHYGEAAGQAASAATEPGAHSGKPNKTFRMLPMMDVQPGEGGVAVGAEYGGNVEYGTVHVPARPFFNPTVRRILPRFDKYVREELQGRIKRHTEGSKLPKKR